MFDAHLESTFAFTYSLLQIDKAHPRQQTKPNPSQYLLSTALLQVFLPGLSGLGRIGYMYFVSSQAS